MNTQILNCPVRLNSIFRYLNKIVRIVSFDESSAYGMDQHGSVHALKRKDLIPLYISEETLPLLDFNISIKTKGDKLLFLNGQDDVHCVFDPRRKEHVFSLKNNSMADSFKASFLHEVQALYTFHTKKQLICSL